MIIWVFFIACIASFKAEEISPIIPIPEYRRGAVPNWFLPDGARENGITYLGSHARLRVVMDKIMRNEPVLISVVGGSNTVGHGAHNGFPWPRYLYSWLEDTFPAANISLHNGAVAGTTSEYMSLCNVLHIPRDSSVVILEYSHNDEHNVVPLWDNPRRRPLERLVRKLLDYPLRQAVIFLHTYDWHEVTPKGVFWGNAERDMAELGLYYSLPAVSVKACCYHLMRKNVTGFRIDHRARHDGGPEMLEKLKYQTWYSDGVHGAGDTGYRGMAELLIHLMMTAMKGLKERPLEARDHKAVAEPLPPPMIPDNWPTSSDRCFVADHLQKAVHGPHDGWSWVDDSKAGRQPKVGYMSKDVGASISFKLNTSLISLYKEKNDPSKMADFQKLLVSVGIAHLRSYEHMGQASLACSGGCECTGDMKLEGMQERRVSQRHIHSIKASQAPNCVLTITVLPTTTSDGHIVKIQGVFISEEEGTQESMARVITTGALDGLENWQGASGAIEFMQHGR